MYIPIDILKDENSLRNFSSKQESVKIFKGMAVSVRRSPLLYNIESGLQITDLTLDGVAARKKIKMRSVNQRKRAKKLLHKINVVRANKPKEFSLLTDLAENMSIDNPAIENEHIFENTFNKYIVATDKFPFAEDPFYKFDNGNISALSYVEEKSEDNKRMRPVDMSKIASGMVSLNLRSNYAGKSKYFNIPLEGL